ncbi:MAG: TonB-dependent receptor plug domain-containing protein, partial [Xanthomonadales bacterium]|nr:TonB-dependent receptor plug domain-containing protein [Xanthomonadales bacterium]
MALPLGAILIAGASAQTAAPAPESQQATEEEVIVLSPFEVTASESSGYAATTTLAGSRINTQLKDVGSAISVVTSEFLKDTGATDSKTLLQYTTNTEVASIQGNFTNAGSSNQQEEGSFTSPNSNTRVRGLSAADNTRNFFITDIPWDAYNVDRVDMQRGANSILFGMGSPAGIINTSTKTAQYRTFGELELRYGSYGANRVSFDYNHSLLADELAFRVAAVRNDEKYKQKPAFSLDRRVFATVRYEPKFLSRNGSKTTIKANYESGTIKSNNPRVITPIDMITPWFTAMNQAGFDPNTVRDNRPRYVNNSDDTVASFSYPLGAENQRTYAAHVPVGSPYTIAQKDYASGGSNPNYNPWLTNVASSYESGPLTYFNADGSAYMVASGVGNLIAARNADGTTKRTLDYFSDASRVAIAPLGTYASNAGVAYKEIYKSSTFSDASLFDFYNNLLDGDNKREWQNFHNFSASLGQTFFNQKMGFELAYDQSVHRRGQYTLLTDQRAG